MLLNNLPMVWVICIVILSIVLVSNHANGGEKTKADWVELYAQAGCTEMGFVNRKICETKVFQKTNWQSGKDQVTNTLTKIGIN